MEKNGYHIFVAFSIDRNDIAHWSLTPLRKWHQTVTHR